MGCWLDSFCSLTVMIRFSEFILLKSGFSPRSPKLSNIASMALQMRWMMPITWMPKLLFRHSSIQWLEHVFLLVSYAFLYPESISLCCCLLFHICDQFYVHWMSSLLGAYNLKHSLFLKLCLLQGSILCFLRMNLENISLVALPM